MVINQHKEYCRKCYEKRTKQKLYYDKVFLEFKPVKLLLKIDLVSYPARAEGLGK